MNNYQVYQCKVEPKATQKKEPLRATGIRVTGILFREESYEALQTKIVPARNQALNRPFPASWLSTLLLTSF